MGVEGGFESLCEFCNNIDDFNETLTGFFNETVHSIMFDKLNDSHSFVLKCQDAEVQSHCSETMVKSTEFLVKHTLPQILLAFVAIVVNSTEFHVIRKRRKLFPSEYLLRSLCVADLMFSCLVCLTMVLGLANEIHNFIPDTNIIAEISHTLIDFSIWASVAHVLSISLDRLIAVVRPLKYRSKVSPRRVKKVILGIWLITLVLTTSIVIYRYHNLESGLVSEKIDKNSNIASSSVLFISGFLVCMIYIMMTQRMIMQAKYLNGVRFTQRQRKGNTVKGSIETVVLISAVVVTVLFMICTVPYAIVQIKEDANYNAHTICQCLLISNSIFNPLIYFWRGHWIKRRRTRNTISTAITDLSKSKNSSNESLETGLATATHTTASVVCTPVANYKTSNMILPKQSKSYDLTTVTLFDVFDIDTISRFRRLNTGFHDRNRNTFVKRDIDIESPQV